MQRLTTGESIKNKKQNGTHPSTQGNIAEEGQKYGVKQKLGRNIVKVSSGHDQEKT